MDLCNTVKRIDLRISCVILAAGESRRLGTNKLLLPFRESTVIESVIAVYDLPAIMEHVIVVGAYGQDIQEKVKNDSIIWATNTRPENEVGSSLQIGLNIVSENADAVIIAHGDMPMIRLETIAGMIDLFKQGSIVIPVFKSKKGHPVMIDRSIAKKCMNPAFTHPLRHIIREHQELVMFFDSSDEGVLLDIDTWEDYNRLLKETQLNKKGCPFAE